jgi:phospholipid N-methyltransferase
MTVNRTNGVIVSLLVNKNVLELNSGNGCITPSILKLTTL